jgi:hypothetical protein
VSARPTQHIHCNRPRRFTGLPSDYPAGSMDPEEMQAMLKMKKIDIAALERAYAAD